MSNKKLLALLVGAGLQLTSAEASAQNGIEHPNEFSINSVENGNCPTSSPNLHDACCGGSTCNGSCGG